MKFNRNGLSVISRATIVRVRILLMIRNYERMQYKRLHGSRYVTKFKRNAVAEWSHGAVRRILQNEVYAGVLVQEKRTTPNYKPRSLCTGMQRTGCAWKALIRQSFPGLSLIWCRNCCLRIQEPVQRILPCIPISGAFSAQTAEYPLPEKRFVPVNGSYVCESGIRIVDSGS